MFGINLETQPEIVQTAAGYLVQGWELAASWLLSPVAWSQFDLLVVAYLAAVLVARRLSPFLVSLLNPGDNGIDLSLEFWVNGIDDGQRKFNQKCYLPYRMH